jgi:hypothetical protein
MPAVAAVRPAAALPGLLVELQVAPRLLLGLERVDEHDTEAELDAAELSPHSSAYLARMRAAASRAAGVTSGRSIGWSSSAISSSNTRSMRREGGRGWRGERREAAAIRFDTRTEKLDERDK